MKYSFSLFWTIVLVSAILSNIYVQMVFLQRFFERPHVTSLERDYYTWNTTFPSFTLCSQRKMNETALKIYLKYKIRNHFKNISVKCFKKTSNYFSSEMISPRRDMMKLEAFLRVLVNLTMFNLDTLTKFGDFESLSYMRVCKARNKRYRNIVIKYSESNR